MSEYTESLIVLASQCIIGFALIGMLIKAVVYLIMRTGWNFLGRVFCHEFNQGKSEDEKVAINSLDARHGLGLALFNFMDYNVPRMIGIDDESMELVLGYFEHKSRKAQENKNKPASPSEASENGKK